MKLISLLIFSIFCITLNAQEINSLDFDKIEGVNKTIMNPKLYPLLLKVHIYEDNNTGDFKNFIGNLKQFEVFSPENKVSGDLLLSDVNSFLNANYYIEVKPNTYELVLDTKKEYIVIKHNADKASIIYAFTTKPNYNGIKKLKLI